jgi:hypothetical protein
MDKRKQDTISSSRLNAENFTPNLPNTLSDPTICVHLESVMLSGEKESHVTVEEAKTRKFFVC